MKKEREPDITGAPAPSPSVPRGRGPPLTHSLELGVLIFDGGDVPALSDMAQPVAEAEMCRKVACPSGCTRPPLLLPRVSARVPASHGGKQTTWAS